MHQDKALSSQSKLINHIHTIEVLTLTTTIPRMMITHQSTRIAMASLILKKATTWVSMTFMRSTMEVATQMVPHQATMMNQLITSTNTFGLTQPQ